MLSEAINLIMIATLLLLTVWAIIVNLKEVFGGGNELDEEDSCSFDEEDFHLSELDERERVRYDKELKNDIDFMNMP